MLSAASSSSAGYQRVASSDALVTPVSGPPPSVTSPGNRQTPSSAPPPIAPRPNPMPAPLQPLAPYPPPHMQHMMTGPPPGPSGHYGPPMQPGGQGQILCSGCRTLLVYPQGASNVRCSLCQFVTAVLPQGSEMAQLVCGGCRTPLMYVRGASSVQCSLCHTVNLAMEANRIGYVNCAGCGQTLMYSAGAQSVKCAVCQFVTQAAAGMTRMPLPSPRPPYMGPQPLHPQPQPQLLQQPGPPRTQTVIVENPDTLDESGQVVSNVAVGVTSTDKKV